MRKRKPVLLNGEALMADGKPLEFDAVDQEELDGKIDAPQTAAVGEVLTVEEVGEDGKPKKWKTQVVDVDGVLKYTEQELTTEEQAQARKNIGAQQTDFIINVKENEDGVVAADKTLVEIKTAYESKVNMWAVFYGNRYIFQGYLRVTDSYLFVCVMDNVVTKYGSISMIEFNSNGNISIHGMEFTALYKMEQIIVGNGGAISGVPLGQNPVPENATYVTVPKASGLKAGKVLTTTGKNGVLAMEWKDINFPVTITSTTTDGVTTYTADKTFAEIKAAYDSGANVYAVYRQGIVPLSGVYNDISAVFYGLLGEIGGKIICNIKIDSDGVELEHSSPVPCVEWNNLIDGLANTPYVLIVEGDNAPDHGGLLFYYYGATSSKLGYKLFTYSGNLYTIEYDRRNNYISSKKTIFALPTVSISDNNKILQVLNGAWTKTELPASLPSPATAQVGQIVKVKAVDESGKITETEAVDIPSVSNDYELVFQETVAEDIRTYSRDTDKDGNPFSLTDVMVIIFTKPFAESTNSAGRGLGFLPTSRWGNDVVLNISNSIKSGGNEVGVYDVAYVKVINGYQICDRYYRSQNATNVFGVMQERTGAGETGVQFHNDATKIMEISRPQGNITCVKIVGYTNPLVSAGTIIALYKKKGT